IGEGSAGVVRGGSTGRHVGSALDVAERIVWEPDPLGGGFAIDCGKRAARAAYAPAIGEGYAHHGRLLMLSGTGYLTLLMPMIEIAPRIDIEMATGKTNAYELVATTIYDVMMGPAVCPRV